MLPGILTTVCVVVLSFVVGIFIGQSSQLKVANASTAVLLAGAKVAQPTR
jgi:UPF0716 family protein affecting phage T7 exclusion